MLLRDNVYENLRADILSCRLAPGDDMREQELAERYAVSRQPVREALLRLEHEGLLESRPRAGTRVRVPTREDVMGHYVVREALEVQAAKLFAGVATARERAELKKLAAHVDELARLQSDRTAYVQSHQKLHRRVAECTRCPALSTTIEKQNVLASIWFCLARSPSTDALLSSKIH